MADSNRHNTINSIRYVIAYMYGLNEPPGPQLHQLPSHSTTSPLHFETTLLVVKLQAVILDEHNPATSRKPSACA